MIRTDSLPASIHIFVLFFFDRARRCSFLLPLPTKPPRRGRGAGRANGVVAPRVSWARGLGMIKQGPEGLDVAKQGGAKLGDAKHRRGGAALRAAWRRRPWERASRGVGRIDESNAAYMTTQPATQPAQPSRQAPNHTGGRPVPVGPSPSACPGSRPRPGRPHRAKGTNAKAWRHGGIMARCVATTGGRGRARHHNQLGVGQGHLGRARAERVPLSLSARRHSHPPALTPVGRQCWQMPVLDPSR